jgi:N-acyl-D-amino-acid deacylase
LGAGTHFDYLIRGGTVIDGTGRKRYRADLGIKDGRIAALGDLSGAAPDAVAGRAIAADGAVVCPGFIDVHNHADGTILTYPGAESCVMQGVTTVLAGQCGFSPAPLVDRWLLSFWEFRFWPDIEPYMFHEPLIHPLASVRKAARDRIGLDIDWRTFGEWMERVERDGTAINIAPLVGHNTIRAQAMGDDHARAATADELRQMEHLLRESLAAGAFGVSTGVDYLPGAHAPLDELVLMARVAADHGRLHSMHWRRTGIRRADAKPSAPPNKLAGILQAVDIGRRTGVRTLISHIVSGFAIHPAGGEELERAAAEATLAHLDAAVADGVDVAFDVIPNVDGGVLLSSHLLAPLVPWVREIGSPAGLARALGIREFRERVRRFLESGGWYNFQPGADAGWAERMTIAVAEHADWQGKTVGQIAAERGTHPMETLFDLIRDEPLARVTHRGTMPNSGIRAFLAHPRGMVGSDTFAFDHTWQVEHPPYLLPHPNTYSAMPWYLERYAPGELEDAIYKLTGLPAAWLGLSGRGELRQGCVADVVVFEPENFRARGDYLEPRRYPAGLRHVLVGGRLVVENGEHNGSRPGRIIRG